MKNKQRFASFLRRFRLLEKADYIKFIISALTNYSDNRAFKRKHPGISLPPPFILYESFGKLSYTSYYNNGYESARYFIDLFRKHGNLENARICEWGCGPARLIRHFPSLLEDENPEVHGTDYNDKTIRWCRENLPGIIFATNDLHPPFDYEHRYFDIVFCVSVFTHLSRKNQILWLDECLRILKDDGIFLLTVHGDSCTHGLLQSEKEAYGTEGCIIRGCVTEGKRTYTAYNNPEFMKNVLLKNLEIVEFIKGENGAQDIWIVKKKQA